MGMFKNEKYKGDFHLQKYYTPEDKRNQTVRNNGEVQSYYMEDSRPAILSMEVWDALQEKIEANKRDRTCPGGFAKVSEQIPLTGLCTVRFAERHSGAE